MTGQPFGWGGRFYSGAGLPAPPTGADAVREQRKQTAGQSDNYYLQQLLRFIRLHVPAYTALHASLQ